ncbi:MAG: hypothetical protein CR975_05910 [Gammaproteobacteria bacterium]|nr:MAG: hypothetical protein CR975_05910 [Gammaproteobacteria bacterium]
MNMSVENEMQNAPGRDDVQEGSQSSLGQLGQAIRRSTLYFIVAAIALVISYAIIINRENLLQNIFFQVAAANKVEIDALQMREAEKDFRLSFAKKDLQIFDEKYQDALKQMETMLSSSGATSSELAVVEQTKTNLAEYKNIIDQAFAVFAQRGFNFDSGVRKTLRNAGVALTAAIDDVGSAEIALAAENVRSKAKDFAVLENAESVSGIKQAIQAFRKTVSANDDLNFVQEKALTDAISAYEKGVAEVTRLTLSANELFAKAKPVWDKTLVPLPSLIDELNQREEAAFTQIFVVLIIAAVILLAIFVLIVFQLRRAQAGANQTLQETQDAQRAAEEENERLNDSVISILEAVSSLSQRDLTARAPVTEDIIGTVSDSINLLADETASVLSGVTGIAGQVSSVSDNVRSQATQVSQTAAEERESVQKMFETLFEATQTMNQVAALAEQSNESAAQATEATEGALMTVNNTVGGMESIRETISEAEKRIKRLGERSQEISGIVNLINTISERTHVLALNASMQAAVAGEAGRGFAVVAEEVQQLAESSRNATEQIATLVNNIQIETNETINTVNRTISQVVEGSEQAQQAGEQMRKTQKITDELVARVQSIARASEQQKNMSAQLLEAVQEIGESTEKTAEQIAAQNVGTEELQTAAKALVDSVNVFKLPQQA